jgi:putative hydrolase of the HAD superfamily
MITFVFFDLVGTLIKPRQPVGEQYARLASRYGADVDARAMEAAFHRAMRTTAGSTPSRDSLESTAAAERRWWEALVRAVVTSCGAAELVRPGVFEDYFGDLYEHFTTADAWEPYEDALPVLDALATKGITTGLITNYDTRVYRVLDAVGLASRLDSVTIPANAGASKPDRRIFDHALDGAGIAPADALHVGDSLGDDYHGATAAGMSAVLLDRDGRYGGTEGLRRIGGLGELLQILH